MKRTVNRTLCVVLAVQFGCVTGKAAAFAHIEGCVKDWQGAVVRAPYTVVLMGPGHTTKVPVDGRGKFRASVRPGLYRATMTGWNILPYERAPILASAGEDIVVTLRPVFRGPYALSIPPTEVQSPVVQFERLHPSGASAAEALIRYESSSGNQQRRVFEGAYTTLMTALIWLRLMAGKSYARVRL